MADSRRRHEPALTGNDYQWALGTDGLPVLQKKQ